MVSPGEYRPVWRREGHLKPRLSTNLRPFNQNLKKLAAGFKVKNKSVIQQWQRSDWFASFFRNFKREYLQPVRDAAERGRRHRQAKIRHVEQIQDLLDWDRRSANCIYSYPDPADKAKWSYIKHVAHFLYHCQQANANFNNGIFWGYSLEEREVYHALWQALIYATRRDQQETSRKRPRDVWQLERKRALRNIRRAG